MTRISGPGTFSEGWPLGNETRKSTTSIIETPEIRGNTLIIRFKADIELDDVSLHRERIQDEILRQAPPQKIKKIIVDVGNLKTMPSIGTGFLITLNTRAKKLKQEFIVCNHEHVQGLTTDVINRMKLPHIMTFKDTLEEAL